MNCNDATNGNNCINEKGFQERSPHRSVAAVALPAAILFVLVGLAILCARPDQGLMVTVTSANLGWSMARRMLPTAFLLPVVIGWLRLQGQHAGLYRTEFGLALSSGRYRGR